MPVQMHTTSADPTQAQSDSEAHGKQVCDMIHIASHRLCLTKAKASSKIDSAFQLSTTNPQHS